MWILISAALAAETDDDEAARNLAHDLDMIDDAWREALAQRDARMRGTGGKLAWTGLCTTAVSAVFLGVGVSWTGGGIALVSAANPPRRR